MKPWPLLIGIVVILGIFCSPGLAVISKSDLISQYQGQSSPTILTPLYPAPSSPIGFIWAYTGKGSFPILIPTPPPISEEEIKEAMAEFYEYMAKHDAIHSPNDFETINQPTLSPTKESILQPISTGTQDGHYPSIIS
jgi:hypothetical protein